MLKKLVYCLLKDFYARKQFTVFKSVILRYLTAVIENGTVEVMNMSRYRYRPVTVPLPFWALRY